MECRISVRHVNLTPEMRSLLLKKVENLTRFYDDIPVTTIHIDKNGAFIRFGMTVQLQGATLHVEAQDSNIGRTLDSAIDRMERRIKRVHARRKNRKAALPLPTLAPSYETEAMAA